MSDLRIEEIDGDFEHEQVVRCIDEGSGLDSIIAVHSTRLGPSLGGTRFYPFASPEDALADVLRLARAMSYKSAAASLDLGGGKAVIIGDPRRDRSEALLRAYGRFVDSLGGRYVTTEDVGTTVEDMEIIRTQTRFVTGVAREHGGSGDPSDATAWGLFSAMRTLARRLWGDDTLKGRHVAIQGVGKVASYLLDHLTKDGCHATVADISRDALDRAQREHGADVVTPDEIFDVDCDVFTPCALGGALNPDTIGRLRCAAIVGCANNQLATPESGELLAGRGIVYAPDYVVNAGGVINLSWELKGYDRDRAFAQVWEIGATLERVLDLAERNGITTAVAADRLAEARLA